MSVVSGKRDGVFAGAITLPPQVKDSTVEYGGSLFGQTTIATGPVAMLTFETSDDFSGQMEIVLTELSIEISGASNDFTPGASVLLNREPLADEAPSPDFDGNGEIEFDDFIHLCGGVRHEGIASRATALYVSSRQTGPGGLYLRGLFAANGYSILVKASRRVADGARS